MEPLGDGQAPRLRVLPDEEVVDSCALDVAERGGLTLGEVAQILGVTRERIRQLEVEALGKLKLVPRAAELAGLADLLPSQRTAPPAVGKVRPKPKAAPSRRSAPAVARRGASPKSRRGRLQPNGLITCTRFQALVPLRTCIQRQAAKWPGKGAPIHDYCGSGQCAQGAGYRMRAAYSAGAEWAGKSKAGRGTFQFFRRDAGLQRQKRRIQALSRPEGEVPTIDTPGAQVPAVAAARRWTGMAPPDT